MRHFMSTLRDAYGRRQRINRTIAELNALSDAELTDLNLSRADFRRIAASAVDAG